ncbi:hypothetical protein A4X06_0g8099 [Tilletia controversa]|uniref:Uncharacterized protein n=1 Tax=Tilletia controversa TaxID=13291 RepID=A0A8X7MLB0_9BASI|nr:hypothetical protein CF328_g7332 [Tilletia controversa]KAE8239685.1 hypothetical protein A4X06_0g8099 [Tilletia controversa]
MSTLRGRMRTEAAINALLQMHNAANSYDPKSDGRAKALGDANIADVPAGRSLKCGMVPRLVNINNGFIRDISIGIAFTLPKALILVTESPQCRYTR